MCQMQQQTKKSLNSRSIDSFSSLFTIKTLSLIFFQIYAGTVNAVPHSLFISGYSFEDVAKVTITLTASHLYLSHALTVIINLFYVRLLQLVGKSRPSASAVEFILGREQRIIANDAVINPFYFCIAVLI